MEIKKILSEIQHRPFEISSGPWQYYQEWNQVLFLHWLVSAEKLRKLVPKELNLDVFNGNTYVSLVAFRMQKIRPRMLPAVKLISDFSEINLRTYVENNQRKGVYFLNIEAEKRLSAFIARVLSGLPYEKTTMSATREKYQSINLPKNFNFECEFKIKEKLKQKNELTKWLTERYCLYLDQGKNIYRYDIHHPEWEINEVELKSLKLNYKVGEIEFNRFPDLKHYSPGVKVLSWQKIKL